MAKSLKRMGIIFFVLVMSFLLICCVTIIFEVSGNNKIREENNISSIVSTQDIPIAEEVILDGKSCEEQALLWKKVVTLAKEGKHILATLMNDWYSNTEYEKNPFGFDEGFSDGRILVPENCMITIDLNGHTIDRQLTTDTRGGCVIYTVGVLNLKDSCYDSASVISYYNSNPNNDILAYAKEKGAGIVTGGNTTGGSGLYSNLNGIVNVYGGVICDNIAAEFGGAISATDNAEINIYDGLFINNTAKFGGALYYYGTNTVNIYGGLFYNNSATATQGGAININNNEANLNIYNVLIAKNTSFDDAGGICCYCNEFNLFGGIIENNLAEGSSTPCSGGIALFGITKLTMTGGIVRNNISGIQSGGIYAEGVNTSIIIKGGVITGNRGNKLNHNLYPGGGVTSWLGSITIGAGAQIYDNYCYADNSECNLRVKASQSIIIDESLINSEKITNVGITCDSSENNVTFTSGYGYGSKNNFAPNKFFFSDNDNKVITLNGTEAQLVDGVKPSNVINWNYNGISTTDSNVILPYSETPYTITSSVGNFYKSNSIISNSFTIKDSGQYSFYAEGNYINPTFMVTIEAPKAKISKPKQQNYLLLYNNDNLISFYPEGFDSNTMEIAYNRQSQIGKYVAKVRLKNVWNSVWADDKSINSVEYKFEIVHPGILVKESSCYEYIYQDNNIRKSYVSGDYIHRLNDNDIATIDGSVRYVMGGISTNTKLSAFLNNLRNDLKLIKIYDKNGIVYDGIASNGIIPESVANILVGTGFKVELYENSTATTAFDTVYLSVLGDINGDGRITASDIVYLREIAKDNSILNTMFVEYQLAAMVNNKGGVTNIDSEILYNVMASEIELNIFFKSGVNTDSSYKYLTLNKEKGKYERVVSETATNVIGNVAVNTKVSEFKANLAILGVNTAGITIYKNEQVLDDNAIVGTGCYFEIAGVKTYISVLGDLNGDGRISASDIMYLNEIKAEDYTAVEDYIILSALILNTGSITSADSIALEVVLEYSIDISNY